MPRRRSRSRKSYQTRRYSRPTKRSRLRSRYIDQIVFAKAPSRLRRRQFPFPLGGKGLGVGGQSLLVGGTTPTTSKKTKFKAALAGTTQGNRALNKLKICVKRSQRKEVLHALKHTGKGGQKSAKWNKESYIKC